MPRGLQSLSVGATTTHVMSTAVVVSVGLVMLGWRGDGVAALDNGLGRTPPMGFNTWNHFGCIPPVGHSGPSDELMRAQAQALVDSGESFPRACSPWLDLALALAAVEGFH